jgi:CheY-like chemotaxis protein
MRALIPIDTSNVTAGSNLQDTDGRASKKKVNRRLASTDPLEILLVDDNAVNVTVGKRILELFGYKNITSANDGQQAIEAAEKRQYDLILLDLQMPVLDGFSAQERIRASPLAGDPCIVALTANADASTQQLCSDAGFFSYLSKPLDIPRLEKILGEVFEYRKQHRLNKQQPVVDDKVTEEKKDEAEKKEKDSAENVGRYAGDGGANGQEKQDGSSKRDERVNGAIRDEKGSPTVEGSQGKEKRVDIESGPGARSRG